MAVAKVSVVGLLLFSFGCLWIGTEAKAHRLVTYWGQNAVFHKYYPPKEYEKNLMYFCKNSKYDTIILAFCYSFFDARNKDSFPSLDFSYHCNTTMGKDYPFLLKCLNFSDAIHVCQNNGKKVLLSLGGAVGIYGFTNSTEPKLFAYRVWNMFLGGQRLPSLRPFGSAILDGVDLDIEGGTLTGYGEFVKELKSYMKTDPTRQYSIVAAPQCPFPDTYLGPGGTKALQIAGTDFDEIHVQFYNNYCSSGSAKNFWPSLNQWLNFSLSIDGPKVLIGMPSSKGGASNLDSDYRTPNEVKEIYDVVKSNSKFGGFMLWEASFDQNNIIDGKVYSEYVADILAGRCPGVLPKTTTAPATTQPSQGNQICMPNKNGYFADPHNCRRFYQCENGKTHHKWCAAKLYWNQKKLTCDWPKNVQCNVISNLVDEIEDEF